MHDTVLGDSSQLLISRYPSSTFFSFFIHKAPGLWKCTERSFNGEQKWRPLVFGNALNDLSMGNRSGGLWSLEMH